MNVHSTSSLQRTVTIRTPENIELTYALAGPGTRAAAYLMDLLVMWLIASLVQNLAMVLLVPLVEAEQLRQWVIGALIVVSFLLYSGYFVFFEWVMSGQTPGKRLLGIRVIKEGGYALRFLDSLVRNLLRIVDFLPFGYGVGLATVLVTPRSQRLGDLAAGTLLVHQEQVPVDLIGPEVPRSSEEEFPLEKLRAVPNDVINVIVHFFQILPELGPRHRQQIAGELVDLVRLTSGLSLGRTQSAEAFLAAVIRQTEQMDRR
ncbi:MAG: RDD family protein [Planctomycetes bacterium]|nr:RDD family protein [Planctomycetota bacterium]